MVYGKLFLSFLIFCYCCPCANATKGSMNARGTAGRTIYLTGSVDSQFEGAAHSTLEFTEFTSGTRERMRVPWGRFWSGSSRAERSHTNGERRERRKEGRKEEQSEDELCNRRPERASERVSE